VNTARGELVDQDAMIQALQNKTIGGYVTDVLDIEPMTSDHPLRHLPNVLITPHIGSRTFDSVQRQGMMAVQNLVDGLNIPLKTSNNS
jgi:D-3-phosphoglycerate dehydrogenase